MKILQQFFYLVAAFALFLGLFSLSANESQAQTSTGERETVGQNLELYDTYKFENGRTYVPVFRMKNVRTGLLEYAFCIEISEPAGGTSYIGAELVTGSSYSKPFHGKVMAITQFANRPDALQTVRSALNDQTLTQYDVLFAAQRAVWSYTDGQSWPYTNSQTFSAPDFLGSVAGSTATVRTSQVQKIYDYFRNTLPAVTDASTPIAEIADISVKWNEDETAFTLEYKIQGQNSDGSALNATRTYYADSVASNDIRALETTIQKNGAMYYSVTLPAVYANKAIAIEIAGKQVYTGYYAIIVDGKQDIGGYTKDKEISYKDREKITIPQTKPKGDLTLQKIDGQTQKALAGAEFALYKKGSTEVFKTAISDGSGKVEFKNLPYGDYYYKETKAASDDYLLDNKEHAVTIPSIGASTFGGQTQPPKDKVITVKNFKKGNFTLFKTDSTGEIGLANAEFDVFKEGETTKLTTLTTDANGLATFEHLAPGSYYLVEVKAPAGYVKLEGTINFTMTKDDYTFTVKNTKVTGKFTLYKVDAADSELKLEGATFTVTNVETNETVEMTEVSKGVYVVEGLAPGKYTYKETRAPAGYMNEEKTGEFEISGDGTAVEKEAIVTNTKIGTGSIAITKYGETDATLLDGAAFGVFKQGETAPFETITTANGGKATLGDLAPGSYYIQELTAPAGYLVNEDKYEFTIPQAGADKMQAVFNKKEPEVFGKFTIYKVSMEKLEPLKGAEFTLTHKESGKQFVEVTGDDGYANFTELPLGNYTVEETVAPHGYDKGTIENNTFTLTKENATSLQPLTVRNNKMPELVGQFTILKLDPDEKHGNDFKRLQGAVFTITHESGAQFTETTGVNGRAHFVQIPFGHYTITEVKAPEGYEVDMSFEKEFTLTRWNSNSSEPYRVYNHKIKEVVGKYTIQKFITKTETPLLGAEFTLTHQATGKTFVKTTGADGQASFTDLPLGTYKVEETKAPAGYMQGTIANDTFTLTKENAEELGKLIVYNLPIPPQPDPEGSVKFVKYDQANKDKYLEGATFEVYRIEGDSKTLVGTVKTNANGIATLGNLKYGQYEFKETVAPQGYIGFVGAVEFTINSTQVLEIPVANALDDACKAFTAKDLLAGSTVTIGSETFTVNAAGELTVPTAAFEGQGSQFDLMANGEKLGTLKFDRENCTTTYTKVPEKVCEAFTLSNLSPGKTFKVNGETMVVPASGKITVPIPAFTNGSFVINVLNEDGSLYMKVTVAEDCTATYQVGEVCDLKIDEVKWAEATSITTYIAAFTKDVAQGADIFVNGKPAKVVKDEEGNLTASVLEEGPITREITIPGTTTEETNEITIGSLTIVVENEVTTFNFTGAVEVGDTVTVNGAQYKVAQDEAGTWILADFSAEDKGEYTVTRTETTTTTTEDTKEMETIGSITATTETTPAAKAGDEVTIPGVTGTFTLVERDGKLTLNIAPEDFNETFKRAGTFDMMMGDKLVGTVRFVENCEVPPVYCPDGSIKGEGDCPTPPEPPNPPVYCPDGSIKGDGDCPPVTPPNPPEPPVTPPSPPVTPPVTPEPPVTPPTPPVTPPEPPVEPPVVEPEPPVVDPELPDIEEGENPPAETPAPPVVITPNPPVVTPPTIIPPPVVGVTPPLNVQSNGGYVLPQTSGEENNYYMIGFLFILIGAAAVTYRRTRRP